MRDSGYGQNGISITLILSFTALLQSRLVFYTDVKFGFSNRRSNHSMWSVLKQSECDQSIKA